MTIRASFCCLTLVLIIGCGPEGSSQARQTPSVSAAASSAATLACRLPVISPTRDIADPPGGWINFPNGDFIRDPASLSARLFPFHVPSYDRASKRWLPVESRYVAPDGNSYILNNDPSVNGGFYLVDVKTGTRKFLLSGDGPPQAPGSWTIVKYANEGIYLWSAGISTVPGLWLLDPTNGAVRLVDGSHYWSAVARGVAWALDPPNGATATIYRIYRLDLKSGEVSTWYDGTTPIRLLSPTPDGDLLVSYGEYGSGMLERVTSPNRLVAEASPDFPQVFEAYMTAPGVWMPVLPGGLALYERGVGARIVTRSPLIFNVAGGCL